MARIGYTKCGVCGNPEATVSEAETGTLSIKCHRCDLSSYAKKNSAAERKIRAALVADPEIEQAKAEPKKAPSKEPAPPQTPPTTKKGGLLMG